MHWLYKPALQALASTLLFASMGAAQITGLCNTGQTTRTPAGCTGVLVTPNPPGGGPNRDGNWAIAYPYPTPNGGVHGPCLLKTFVKAWVDSLDGFWVPDSTTSEWITPYDGENPSTVTGPPPGWYVYATSFPIPAVLPGGPVPTGVIINGQVTSDNSTIAIYLESPANSGSCSLVSGQQFPVIPVDDYNSSFTQWWPFRFKNKLKIAPGAEAYLYFVVQNYGDVPTPTGFRAEFFDSSAFY